MRKLLICLSLVFLLLGSGLGKLLAGNTISTIASLKINDATGVLKYQDSIVTVKGIGQSYFIEPDRSSRGNYSIYDSTGSIIVVYNYPNSIKVAPH